MSQTQKYLSKHPIHKREITVKDTLKFTIRAIVITAFLAALTLHDHDKTSYRRQQVIQTKDNIRDIARNITNWATLPECTTDTECYNYCKKLNLKDCH